MGKKDLVLYSLILILVVLFLWQWLSKENLGSQITMLQKYNYQLFLLSGIGWAGFNLAAGNFLYDAVTHFAFTLSTSISLLIREILSVGTQL